MSEIAARKTLEGMGYTYTGGELWRPPLGPRPNFDLLELKDKEIKRLRENLATVQADREFLSRALIPQLWNDKQTRAWKAWTDDTPHLNRAFDALLKATLIKE